MTGEGPVRPGQRVDLSRYDRRRHVPGAGPARRACWYLVNALVFAAWWCPLYGLRRALLRAFGARVGTGVVIKPRVNIKYPWRLAVGDHAWIGEGAWIDNIERVEIGAHACISQGVYLCTGNHDWSDPAFRLIARPIRVGDQAWIGAFAIVGPGVSVGEGAVVTAGGVLVGDARPWTIYSGNPAVPVGARRVGKSAGGEPPRRE